jgi:hypothetical protein
MEQSDPSDSIEESGRPRMLGIRESRDWRAETVTDALSRSRIRGS